MYILLSSTEQAYRVGVRLQRASADAAQVSVAFSGTTVPKLGERAAQQLGYAQKAAEAAHVSLSPLDWHHKLLGQLTLTPICGDALVFEAGSSSAGLGYALALHLAFRRKLGKHLPATMPVVFATGAVESSGVVEKIGHLATKLQGAFHCAQSHHAGEPFVVYYPKANEADVSDEHHAQALQLGGRLVAVSRLGEALLDLLGDTYDGDLDSRLEPFKGLASFDYSDHFIFFGREEALSRLVQDYHKTTGLLVVTGVSGAGKSSLIKAGLLPQLVRVTPSLRYSITQPKRHDSLAALLQYFLDSDYPDSPVAANALLSQDKEAESVFIDYANTQPATFWYLDQFEEAANLFPEAMEGSQFTALLHRLACTIPGLSVVISVRSEYLSSIGVVPNESPVSQSIPPMGFKSIIENQARAFGLHYEDGLVARLVEDATAIQHALPALEYMLQQMNELRKQTSESKTLTHAQYDALGGLKGGITQQLEGILHAHERQSDEFFEYAIGLNEAGQLYARSMIKEQIPQPLQPLIHALIDKQLLIGFQTEHGTRLRLAHDSLLQTTWPRLKAWLEPENGTSRKGYLHWLEHNWGDFQKWSALNGSEEAKEYLLTRNNLTEGNAHLTAANLIQRQDVRDYISASQANQQEQARQETQKQRRRVGIFVSIAFIALIAAGWAYIQFLEAREQRNIANEKTIIAEEQRRYAEENEKRLVDYNEVMEPILENAFNFIFTNQMQEDKFIYIIIEAYYNNITRNKMTELISSTLERSSSVNDEEKKYWMDILPHLNKDQLGRLLSILSFESRKIEAIESNYQKDIKNLKKPEKVNNIHQILGTKSLDDLKVVLSTCLNDFYKKNKSITIEKFKPVYIDYLINNIKTEQEMIKKLTCLNNNKPSSTYLEAVRELSKQDKLFMPHIIYNDTVSHSKSNYSYSLWETGLGYDTIELISKMITKDIDSPPRKKIETINNIIELYSENKSLNEHNDILIKDLEKHPDLVDYYFTKIRILFEEKHFQNNLKRFEFLINSSIYL
ncbi:TPA: hypothetical protein I7213_09580 [Vibrio vulnificus]|nr:hypothetical protein [Vibrio vulnificus]HDY7578933.1 hypothetical protein [Vibrio vulnificus]